MKTIATLILVSLFSLAAQASPFAEDQPVCPHGMVCGPSATTISPPSGSPTTAPVPDASCWHSINPDPRGYSPMPMFPYIKTRLTPGEYFVLVGPSGTSGKLVPPSQWRQFGPYIIAEGSIYGATLKGTPASLTLRWEKNPSTISSLVKLAPGEKSGFLYLRNDTDPGVNTWHAFCVIPVADADDDSPLQCPAVVTTPIPAGAAKVFSYGGMATYDGQPATMELTLKGDSVTGNLNKPGVCESDKRLTATSLELKGTLTGSWEGAGMISGTWTGGDKACGKQLTLADGYPQNGTFTITFTGNQVRLLRTGAPPLPSFWSYDFCATGKTITPTGVPVADGAPVGDAVEAARRAYEQAFKRYTSLVTTGGTGNVAEALETYRAAYKHYQDQINATGVAAQQLPSKHQKSPPIQDAAPSRLAQKEKQVALQIPVVKCTSTGQVCAPGHTASLEGSGEVWISYTAGDRHCSDVAVRIRVDDLSEQETGFVSAGMTTEELRFTLPDTSTHRLTVTGIGRKGGCNTGTMRGWTGSLTLKWATSHKAKGARAKGARVGF